MENEYRLFCMNSIGYWILSIWLFTWILDIPCWVLDIENWLFTRILDILQPCWVPQGGTGYWILSIGCSLGYWISSSPAGARKAARGIGY